MKKKILAMLLAVLMIFSLAACGGDGGDADSDKVYELSFSLLNGESNFQSQAWTNWANAINEASDGRLNIKMYYDSTMIDSSAEYQQLLAGVADIVDAHRYASDGFAISENWKCITSGIPADAVVDFSYRLYNEIPAIADEYKDVKVLAQAWNGGTTYQLLTVNKPVHSPDDMKGMTIWCEADWNGFIKACGATPVNVPFNEVYSGLSKNMYDGLMIAEETLQSCSFAEVCKYSNQLNLSYASEPGHLMNLDSWNALPEDLQKLIDDHASMIEEEQMAAFIKTTDEAFKWAQETYGVERVDLTDEEEAVFLETVRKANLEKAKELDAKGLPGTEIVESLAKWTEEWNSNK